MRDDDDGQLELPVDVLDEFQDGPGCLRVECAGGLIAEQHFRFTGEGAGDAYALLLSTGQLARVLVRLVLEAHQLQQRFDLFADLIRRQAGEFQRESNIVIDVSRRQQIEVLEYHADSFTGLTQLGVVQGGHLFVVDDDAAGGRPLKQVDTADQRRFAGAAEPDDSVDFATGNLKVDSFECLDGA